MRLEDLQTMWELDSHIDDEHLGEASTKTPSLHAKYIKILTEFKLKHAKINSEYLVLKRKKFKYYRGEMGRNELEENGWEQWQGIKPLKNELDHYIECDNDIIDVTLKLKYIESVIDFLESVLQQIKSRDFQISNGIKWKQFLVGM